MVQKPIETRIAILKRFSPNWRIESDEPPGKQSWFNTGFWKTYLDHISQTMEKR